MLFYVVDKPSIEISVSVAMAENELKNAKLPVNIMIDCSHGNSNKDTSVQPLVLDNIVNQIGNKSIMGVMIESNLLFGTQELTKDLTQLEYGVSITDACIDWQTTEDILVKS